MNVPSKPTVIGRRVMIEHNGEKLEATVIDNVAGENLAKRVRIQRHRTLAGNVLMPGQYKVLEFLS